MKHNLSVLFVAISFFFTLNTQAQMILNGGFENWTPTLIFTIEPDDWTTDNAEVAATVIPDSMAYEGDLAMRVRALPSGGMGLYGEAHQTIDIQFIPEALYFYAKWQKTNTAFVNVSIIFYNNESTVYEKYWVAETDTSSWTPIVLMLDQIEPIITHVTIKVSSEVGDLAAGEGWISIDDMSFGLPNSIHEFSDDLIQISPNPCKDFIKIQGLDNTSIADGYMVVQNIEGKTVYQGKACQVLDTSTMSEGLYILKLTVDKITSESKFVVKH